MITAALAADLHEAGLIWSPVPGDRFMVRSSAMQGEIFYLADMTVEVHDFVGGAVIGFNGVAEWALDSVDLDDTLWLPREDQMRVVLGAAFIGLAATPDGYAVMATVAGKTRQYDGVDAERAYAEALLALLLDRD